MREIIFDTETTGLYPDQGDRIVEVGCIEVVNYLPTGREFQAYIHPGRPVSEATVRITGITNETLKGKPPFGHPDIVDKLLEFFGDSPIVAHNADFDRGFLNKELELLGRPQFAKDRFIDTLPLAKEHRPGSPASLDAVCKRFNISLEDREFHGALKDAKLLALAYLELRGGKERAFEFATANLAAASQATYARRAPRPVPLPSQIRPEEAAAHTLFVDTLGDKEHDIIWKRFAS